MVTAGHVAAEPPTEEDYFGTVVSVGNNLLVITAEGTTIEIPTTVDTTVRLPLKRDADLSDLFPGDRVAVSLEDVDGILVAEKVFVIPGKTRFRHLPGEVTALSDTEITIQPPAEGAETITFTRTETTTLKLHKRVEELAVGSFVIVVAVRDPVTGELLLNAREIHVTGRKPKEPEEPPVATTTIVNTAEIEGPFQGISTTTGRWIVGGTEVLVDDNTKVEDAVSIGQIVEIEAEVLPDGSLRALRIEAQEEERRATSTTKLQGVFQGTDPVDPNVWLISGHRVIIVARTDTDGLPFIGQRVKVKARLLPNGDLEAREVENERGLNPNPPKDGV